MNTQIETIRNEKELKFLDLTQEFYCKLKAQKERYHKRLQTAKEIGDYSLAAKMQERIMGMGKAKKIFKSSKNILKDEYYKKLKGEK